MDLTIIPEKLRTDENSIYIMHYLSIFKICKCIDIKFLKIRYNFGNIKSFINAFGKPNILYSDNGKEFCNELIISFCKENSIIILRVKDI